MFDALIGMHLFYWHFWLSPRVRYTLVAVVDSNFFDIADKRHSDTIEYRRFRRQLFHTSLANILASVRPAMTVPEVVRTPDGHFRRVIYSLGPYIADYPEQALLTCVVQGWCPRYVASARATSVLTTHTGVVVQHGLENSTSLASAAHEN